MKLQKLKKGCDTCDIGDTSNFLECQKCRWCHIPLVGFVASGSLFNFSGKVELLILKIKVESKETYFFLKENLEVKTRYNLLAFRETVINYRLEALIILENMSGVCTVSYKQYLKTQKPLRDKGFVGDGCTRSRTTTIQF